MVSQEQKYDYLLILDFEATCDKDRSIGSSPEIIEFPTVILNTKTLQQEGEFQRYVRPTVNPILSKFCTELTGITQVEE
jgi:inhibitor of KinA sporulation pathway (predicted exonuclease)